MRLTRPSLLLLCAAAAVLGPLGPARGVGAQGVDLTPLVPRTNGTLTATVAPETTIPIRLANTAEEPRTVAVSVNAATRAVGGGHGIGAPLDWITVEGGDGLTLGPGEVVELEATVDVEAYRAADLEQILFMLEVDSGSNITPRAATVVALTDSGGEVPLPVTIVIAAIVLLALVTAAWWRWGRPLQRTAADVGDRPVARPPRTWSPPARSAVRPVSS